MSEFGSIPEDGLRATAVKARSCDEGWRCQGPRVCLSPWLSCDVSLVSPMQTVSWGCLPQRPQGLLQFHKTLEVPATVSSSGSDFPETMSNSRAGTTSRGLVLLTRERLRHYLLPLRTKRNKPRSDLQHYATPSWRSGTNAASYQTTASSD